MLSYTPGQEFVHNRQHELFKSEERRYLRVPKKLKDEYKKNTFDGFVVKNVV